MSVVRHDGVLIVGGGMAGLAAALAAGPRPVLLAARSPLLDGCASAWAQGGVAAALSRDDAPALHAADTVAAGAGLTDPDAARVLAEAGAQTVAWLADLGAPFDRDERGDFAVSREAAHGLARVARVGGDGAGRAILSALVAAVRAAPHVTVWEDARLVGLSLSSQGGVAGAVFQRGRRRVEAVAPAVVLATGGVGGLYAVTTNPAELTGQGLALAARAGAEILDPEFVQFHPTALDLGRDPAPLATEALRGEGARLIDGAGRYLMGPGADADLAPRDAVARAVHAARTDGRGAFLDARALGERLPRHFPAVFAACLSDGLDPREQPMPVAPAAHYHMGGIAADLDGRTTLAGLFAVGECAATRVHGANRLASNSLLEAAAFGRRAGRAAAASEGLEKSARQVILDADLPSEVLIELRQAMSRHDGVVRDARGLETLSVHIDQLSARHPQAGAPVAAGLIVRAALARCESRGGHWRADYPLTLDVAVHTRLTLPVAPAQEAA